MYVRVSGMPHASISDVLVFRLQIRLIVLLIVYSSGYSLLRDPHHNKGLAFTFKERDAHYIRGLLPPVVMSQELQVRHISSVFWSFSLSLVIIILLNFSNLTYSGEETVAQYPPVSTPTAEVLGLDGPCGDFLTPHCFPVVEAVGAYCLDAQHEYIMIAIPRT